MNVLDFAILFLVPVLRSSADEIFGLLSKFIVSGLEDDNTYVSRGVMDIISNKYPISSISDLDFKKDLIGLTVTLITRKDISLSRRFFTWLSCGGSIDSISFENIDSLKRTIVQNTGSKDLKLYTKCFKVLVCILDYDALAMRILPGVVLDVIKNVSKISKSDSCKTTIEIADQFFELIPLDVFWSEVINASEASCDREYLEAIYFALSTLSVKDADASNHYFPILIGKIFNATYNDHETESFSCVVIEYLLKCLPRYKAMDASVSSKSSPVYSMLEHLICHAMADKTIFKSSKMHSFFHIIEKTAEYFLNDRDALTKVEIWIHFVQSFEEVDFLPISTLSVIVGHLKYMHNLIPNNCIVSSVFLSDIFRTVQFMTKIFRCGRRMNSAPYMQSILILLYGYFHKFLLKLIVSSMRI